MSDKINLKFARAPFETAVMRGQLSAAGIEVSDDVDAITQEEADEHLQGGFAALQEAAKKTGDPRTLEPADADSLEVKSSIGKTIKSLLGLSPAATANKVLGQATYALRSFTLNTTGEEFLEQIAALAKTLQKTSDPKVLAAADKSVRSEFRAELMKMSRCVGDFRVSYASRPVFRTSDLIDGRPAVIGRAESFDPDVVQETLEQIFAAVNLVFPPHKPLVVTCRVVPTSVGLGEATGAPTLNGHLAVSISMKK